LAAGTAREHGRLLQLASDPSPAVRAAVAEAARRFPQLFNTPIVVALLAQPGTAQDPMLPQLIWYVAEPEVAKDPAPLLEAFAAGDGKLLSSGGPLVPRSVGRRLYASTDAKLVEQLFTFLKSNKDRAITAAVLDGVIAGHRKFMPSPAGGEEILAALSSTTNKAVADRAKQLAALWGEKSAVEAALKAIADPKAPDADRLAAMGVVRTQKSEATKNALLAVLAEKKKANLKEEALRALADIGDDATAGAIVKAWPDFTPETRRVAAGLLAARPAWAKALLEGVQAKAVAASDIPLPAIRTLSNHKDLQSLMASTIGAYRPTPGDKQKVIEAKKAVVMNGEVNKQRGHDLFVKNCAVCHQLNGEGANAAVGPDLTGVGRGTLDLLMNNVIDPDQIIGAGYENVIIETSDGETHTGRLVEETAQYVKLLAAGPREDVVSKKEIKERRVSPKSVMPEGFEQILKDDEFRDLMRYVLEAPVGKPE
jgi:putative heme-binding domain-containing protein